MNLVLSGEVDEGLLQAIVERSRPTTVLRLHARAWRLVDADDSASAHARVAGLCEAARVDHAYVEEGRRFSDFKLLAMDMDSTLITIECIDEIADLVGRRKEVAAITAAAMRGEIPDFAESLRRRLALLEGTSVSVLERVYDERLRLSPGAEQLLAAARAADAFTLLLSGGFTYFTDRLKDDFQLRDAYANVLEVEGGALTGRVRGPILDAAGKRQCLERAMKQLGCDRDQVLVIGDGANDIPMMRAANYSIAYHAKPATNQAARWMIRYGNLATVLDYVPPGAIEAPGGT